MLTLYNTLSRNKAVFEPREAGKVGMYVCGITVYDFCHIGHARVFVVFDLLYRHLLASGFDVTYVRNITDVDDKIIARAAQNNESITALTTRYIEAMHQDEAALSVARPTHEPRATDAIGAMIALIDVLIERGYAYAASNGDVYYSVTAFADYGKLSGRKLDDMRAGERVAIDTHKNDPMDFVLWKSVKPGEPAWDSPWGSGRPGWHIECSAMAKNLLGEHFDIHGGGMDLQFPHHENEKAQSEAAHGRTFANYWLHNGFVRVDEEKMSKSLDNFFTVREVLEVYSGEELRMFITNSHYRSPLNYSIDQLDAARASLRRLYNALRGHPSDTDLTDAAFTQRFNDAMDDDLNTPEALAVLFDLATELNRQKDDATAAVLASTLRTLGARLALLQDNPETVLQAAHGNDALSAEAIEALIADRTQARLDKNWARSDEIRDELVSQGVVLEDVGGKTTWRRG